MPRTTTTAKRTAGQTKASPRSIKVTKPSRSKARAANDNRPAAPKAPKRRPRPELYPACSKACDAGIHARRATQNLVKFLWSSTSTGPVPEALTSLVQELMTAQIRADEAADLLEDLGACDTPKGGR